MSAESTHSNLLVVPLLYEIQQLCGVAADAAAKKAALFISRAVCSVVVVVVFVVGGAGGGGQRLSLCKCGLRVVVRHGFDRALP